MLNNAYNPKYASMLYKSLDSGRDEIEKTMTDIKYLFVNDEGISELWAEKICSSLKNALFYLSGEHLKKVYFVHQMELVESVNLPEWKDADFSELLTDNGAESQEEDKNNFEDDIIKIIDFMGRMDNFETEIKNYDVNKIKSYKPSDNFYNSLESYCKSVYKDKDLNEYMSSKLIKRFNLQSEKVFLAIDIYYKVELFKTGLAGVIVSKSGITTNSEHRGKRYCSFLDLALANNISYHDYCVFADDRQIAFVYSGKNELMLKIIDEVRYRVRADLLEYLEN